MSHILVVEDDRDIAQLVERYLTRAGHVVTLVDPLWSVRDDDHRFEDHLVLDPDIGQMLIALDNTRIATVADLRAHREISYRSNFNNFRHGHEFYFGTGHQTLDEPMVWGTFPDYLLTQ